MHIEWMSVAVVLLPLLGGFIAALGKFSAKPKRFAVAGCVAVATSALLALWVLVKIYALGQVQIIPLGSWIEAANFKVAWGLRVDSLSALMMAMVTVVSALVHVYSLGYVAHHQPRFFFALGLFTFAMLVLVSAENLLQLFLGWEAVGFCSYLLIGFYLEKPSAAKASIKAFVMNRVGDVGMILALCALFFLFKSLDFSTLFALIPIHSEFQVAGLPAYEVVALLLFLGAMGKSAQLGLHTWLPDAMEGPTPVSALIHAATMVTAGVFLLVRMSPLFALAPFALGVVLTIGVATALFASLVAARQNDIKRIIAWSTCSQLGYMFAAVGATAWGAAIFHMVTHAFFKALLFLGAGAVIHSMAGEQDIRKMGGLATKMPLTKAFMTVAAASLAGVPFLSGYYSKDFILEAVAGVSTLAVALALLATAVTAFYSFRLVAEVFYTHKSAPKLAYGEEPVMALPMFVAALGSVFMGYGAYELLVGDTQADFWRHNVDMISQMAAFERAYGYAATIPYIATGMVILGIAVYFVPRVKRLEKLRAFFEAGGRVDEFYNRLWVQPYKALSINLWKVADLELIQKQWVEGIALKVYGGGKRVALVQSGKLYDYVLLTLASLTAAILWLNFSR